VISVSNLLTIPIIYVFHRNTFLFTRDTSTIDLRQAVPRRSRVTRDTLRYANTRRVRGERPENGVVTRYVANVDRRFAYICHVPLICSVHLHFYFIRSRGTLLAVSRWYDCFSFFFTSQGFKLLLTVFLAIVHENVKSNKFKTLKRKGFAEISKNLARYRFENNFVKLLKII